jgi:hypothetical protein
VIYTVKLYQALNGGIWYKLGLQMHEVYKLDYQANAAFVRQFIEATRAKRTAGQNALKFVEVNAVEDIQGANHTISNNNQKIVVLRKSVATYVDAIARQPTFERLVADQNIPLDAMMGAYLGRVEEITANMEGAARVFENMSFAYEDAVYDMDVAIQTFEEQGALVSAEIVKHLGILALEIANLTQSIDNAKENPFGAIMVLAQGFQILSDLRSMQETLSAFNETKDWFDAHSREILAASRGARQELAESLKTLQAIRPVLAASWRKQCGAVGLAAAELRREQTDFETQLEEMRRRGMQKAATVEKTEMEELDALLKKPRRLRS